MGVPQDLLLHAPPMGFVERRKSAGVAPQSTAPRQWPRDQKSLIFDSNFYTFHFIRKSGVFCSTLRPGVQKTILFFDESAHTVLGGGRDRIYRGDV